MKSTNGITLVPPMAKLGIFAAFILIFPMLFKNPYYLNIINIIGINCIIVVGLNLLIGYAGQISLGHAAFYGLGAYISGVLSTTYGLSPWLTTAIAILATGLLALIIAIPTLRLHGHYLVMATLGFNIIVNIILIQWDAVTGGPSGFPGIPSYTLGSLAFDSDLKMYYLIWGILFISVILAINLVKSRAGRALRAIHSSEIAATCFGVCTRDYKIKIFVLSAMYASLAGSLYAHYLTFISPKTFDIFFSVELVTMVIVGGMGSVWGVLVGTAFLTSLPNILHFFDEYKDVFYGLILVLILVFVPEGLFVSVRNNLRKMKARGFQENGNEADKALQHQSSISFLPRSAAKFDHNKPILDVHNVSMMFGGIAAVSDVSFRLMPNSITALIGPNGAGKTTLLNCISGIHSARNGMISFLNNSISNTPCHRLAGLGITRTFQNNQIFSNMTVLENLMVGAHGIARNEFLNAMFRFPGFKAEEQRILQRSHEVMDFFGLQNIAEELAGSLPFGIQKKIEMARALIPYPKLMLLDEPVAGLNMTESVEIAKLITKMRNSGITVLLVEHDMNIVMKVAEHIIVLNYGSKIAEGTPREIQHNDEVLDAYLGSIVRC